MIVDADPGDECDAEQSVPRMVAFIKRHMENVLAQYLKPFTFDRAVYMPVTIKLEPYILIECVLVQADLGDHDPGDEDRRDRVSFRDLALELAA